MGITGGRSVTTSCSLARSFSRLLGSILCDRFAVAKLSHARLPSAEFTLLSRCSPTGRTSDSEYLFWAEFFCHQTSTYKRVVN